MMIASPVLRTSCTERANPSKNRNGHCVSSHGALPRPVMQPARSMHWPVVVIVNVNGGDHAR